MILPAVYITLHMKMKLWVVNCPAHFSHSTPNAEEIVERQRALKMSEFVLNFSVSMPRVVIVWPIDQQQRAQRVAMDRWDCIYGIILDLILTIKITHFAALSRWKMCSWERKHHSWLLTTHGFVRQSQFIQFTVQVSKLYLNMEIIFFFVGIQFNLCF